MRLEPGVRAVIVGLFWPEMAKYNGSIVTVSGAPFISEVSGRVVLPISGLQEDPVVDTSACEPQHLIPLPGDDDAKRLFRETERPKEVSNA